MLLWSVKYYLVLSAVCYEIVCYWFVKYYIAMVEACVIGYIYRYGIRTNGLG